MKGWRDAVVGLLLASSAVLAPGSAVFAQQNAELARMFAEDQAARRGPDIDWEALRTKDEERRKAAMALLAAGEIRTAQDYYHAAMIFQHGESAEEIRLAHAFATIASALQSSPAANWLVAASWDRLLVRFGQPQWYGTQYVRDDEGKWVLYEVDPDAVTDEQRAERSVPSLEESLKRVEQLNSGAR